jgi:putative two-component system response regulator
LNGKNNNKEYVENNFNEVRDTIFKIDKLLQKYFSNSFKKKIAIVDDSNIVLNYLDSFLKTDYEIIKCNCGEAAISTVSTTDLYAIFLDLNMPGVNGFQVLSFLKDNKLIEKIPVVIITGDDSTDTINQAFNYPIIDVLNKPFNESNINRVLESIKNFYEK